MSWLIWPAALVLCVLCAIGLVGMAVEDWRENRQNGPPAHQNNYYPAWLKNCITRADEFTYHPKKTERTVSHGHHPQ